MKNDVMVGELDYEQSNIYVMLRENQSTGIMVYDCQLRGENCKVTALCSFERTLRTKQMDSGFNFDITLKINADVMEISSLTSMTPSTEELEILAEALLAREVLAIDREQAQNCDTEEFWRNANVTVSAESILEAVTP